MELVGWEGTGLLRRLLGGFIMSPAVQPVADVINTLFNDSLATWGGALGPRRTGTWLDGSTGLVDRQVLFHLPQLALRVFIPSSDAYIQLTKSGTDDRCVNYLGSRMYLCYVPNLDLPFN